VGVAVITFQVREARNGISIATVDGIEYRDADPIRIAARALISSGSKDQPWQMCRGERVDMSGPSIFGLAFTAISETDAGLNKTLWTRHFKAAPDPVLDPLLAEFSACWKTRRDARRRRP
jgi:hypothetical protein